MVKPAGDSKTYGGNVDLADDCHSGDCGVEHSDSRFE